jgi:hypothetical protein
MRALLFLACLPLCADPGWKTFNGDGFPTEGWEIRDGVIRAVPAQMMPCLATAEEYDDFDMHFEWRISPGGNAGVFYLNRMDRVRPGHHRVHSSRGQEYQILDDLASREAVVPSKSAAARYGKLAPIPGKPLKPAGEWNEGRIVVRGLRAEHWLNGVKVLEYELKPEEKVPSPIVLQHHHDEAWFRNIRIQRLR